jgi:TATA-box binding protein (TBP) (component of TFIID and TFIIIB)
METFDIDKEWKNFLNDSDKFENEIGSQLCETGIDIKCSDLYISTKTKIAFLNTNINVFDIFWKLPIIHYYQAKTGIIKKQMKSTCFSKEECEKVNALVKIDEMNGLPVKQSVISHLDNPTSKAKVNFKHVEKVSIGTCKKDFISYRTKEKGAFYNCFALIFRIPYNNEFKEVHVKVFNTGKLEIPGIQDNDLMYKAFDILLETLQPLFKKKLFVDNNKIDTVLINSNFNCGYYINRQKLFSKLKYDCGLISMYDPCSYPGIQSKFYYNNNKTIQNGICECSKRCNKKGKGNGDGDCMEVSFMIFRTGSVLIVGNCDEDTLNEIYLFIKNILESEYSNVNEGLLPANAKTKNTKRKQKKYTVIIDDSDN